MIERPSNLATEKPAHLVEDTWDRHGQPLRYSTNKTFSPPSKEFWADFERFMVEKGITMLGLSVAPSRIDLEKSDLKKSDLKKSDLKKSDLEKSDLEKSPIETKEKGRVLMQRPKPGSDRERVATYEPYDKDALNSKSNEEWVRYTTKTPLGNRGGPECVKETTGTSQTSGTSQNCVNQCGPD